MAEETRHGGRVGLSKSTAFVLGDGKKPCHLKMTTTPWIMIHMSGVSDSQKYLKPLMLKINNHMRNHKLLTQIPGKLEHSLKCRCNQSFTLDDITNTLQDGGIQWQTQIKNGRSDQEENTCHKCVSIEHYANNCPKAKKVLYSIDQGPEEEFPTEDSESDSMGHAIREQYDDYQDPREELLVEYQEETQIEIQDIKLEAGIPQDAANRKLCKHTQDAQTFLVKPTKEMQYIHGKAIISLFLLRILNTH
ncbi:hypothetical protein O181_061830 [Austropuccinia psidii MF-1]|uniref:CCHC-type domain-containing protein n=1 Tax=Austropuccinia psidii MF-1 TaxID=1389203 RepID=A0A9Q3I0U9_9BASI|nr:hypothetical protein [Austropuccinia psidii MF-1]